ncbi:MAG: hypothetical protein FJ390_01985 [Verrucomicrobia bacterium]|nr:hypothetical protein [Verrucomicrobiota bacterium]
MYTDIRFGSAYRNPNNDSFFSDRSGGKKINQQGSPSLPISLKSENVTTSKIPSENEKGSNISSDLESVSDKQSEKENVFAGQEIQQVETSSRTSDILKAGYTSSNRAAVALGLTGGLVGGILKGPPGAAFGMSVGSSAGSHLGAIGGVLMESSKSPVNEQGVDPEQSALDAVNNPFFGHAVALVDHAAQHATAGSIGVGVAALLASLATGNPFPVAFHAAGVYSGATWAFGLTTGSAHWLLQHLERSEERLQREQISSPGDIELRPFTSTSLKEVENHEDPANTISIK